jgi:DHA2 family methylenomycin A resistance protein-like MFS transporter
MTTYEHKVDEPHRSVVLVVMCIGYFLVLLDVTIVNVALPRLGADLGAGVAGLQWVVDGYAVALASLLLASGVVGDRFGHRRLVLSGLAVFGIASLGCAVSTSTGLLIAARVVQGVGAALLLPGTLALIADTFPGRKEQARAIGAWAGVGGLALPAGPLLGGLLVQTIGWRSVFAINVPITAVAWLVTRRVVRESQDRARTPLDIPGVALGALLLAALTLAATQAGAGNEPLVIGAAAVACAALVGFLHVERHSDHPMLPPGLWRRPGFAIANGTAAIMNLGTLGLLFVLTAYLQTVQHRSALEAGLTVLPLFIPLALLAPLSGRVSARVGPKVPMIVGLLIAAAGVASMYAWQPDTSTIGLVPGLLLWGIGVGILTPAVVAAAVDAVDPARRGLASGFNNTGRQAGGAIGIAAYGAVAGSAGAGAGYVSGIHTLGVLTAGLFVAVAVAAAFFVPRPARG